MYYEVAKKKAKLSADALDAVPLPDKLFFDFRAMVALELDAPVLDGAAGGADRFEAFGQRFDYFDGIGKTFDHGDRLARALFSIQ